MTRWYISSRSLPVEFLEAFSRIWGKFHLRKSTFSNDITTPSSPSPPRQRTDHSALWITFIQSGEIVRPENTGLFGLFVLLRSGYCRLSQRPLAQQQQQYSTTTVSHQQYHI
jgi:hypothetical protein